MWMPSHFKWLSYAAYGAFAVWGANHLTFRGFWTYPMINWPCFTVNGFVVIFLPHPIVLSFHVVICLEHYISIYPKWVSPIEAVCKCKLFLNVTLSILNSIFSAKIFLLCGSLRKIKASLHLCVFVWIFFFLSSMIYWLKRDYRRL